jgi:hypothetical protein
MHISCTHISPHKRYIPGPIYTAKHPIIHISSTYTFTPAGEWGHPCTGSHSHTPVISASSIREGGGLFAPWDMPTLHLLVKQHLVILREIIVLGQLRTQEVDEQNISRAPAESNLADTRVHAFGHVCVHLRARTRARTHARVCQRGRMSSHTKTFSCRTVSLPHRTRKRVLCLSVYRAEKRATKPVWGGEGHRRWSNQKTRTCEAYSRNESGGNLACATQTGREMEGRIRWSTVVCARARTRTHRLSFFSHEPLPHLLHHQACGISSARKAVEEEKSMKNWGVAVQNGREVMGMCRIEKET